MYIFRPRTWSLQDPRAGGQRRVQRSCFSSSKMLRAMLSLKWVFGYLMPRCEIRKCKVFAAVGSFILGNDRWSLVRSFDPSFASGNSQWKNLLYDALWPISSRVIRNWHVLAQQKIVLAQRKIACARSQLELSFLVDRSQDLRSLSYLQQTSLTAALTSQWELLV